MCEDKCQPVLNHNEIVDILIDIYDAIIQDQRGKYIFAHKAAQAIRSAMEEQNGKQSLNGTS